MPAQPERTVTLSDFVKNIWFPTIEARHAASTVHFYRYYWDHILSIVPEPSRTAIAVAAFAGLRRGEIEGLLWESYDGESYRAFQNIPKSPSVSQR